MKSDNYWTPIGNPTHAPTAHEFRLMVRALLHMMVENPDTNGAAFIDADGNRFYLSVDIFRDRPDFDQPNATRH